MSQPSIAILSPRSADKAESFIRNHIEHLPYDVTVIHGGYLPWKSEGYPDNLSASVVDRLIARVTRRELDEEQRKREQLRLILKERKVQVVLAEYILSGAAVADVCAEMNIPLIATGLGYELSVYSVLEGNKPAYQRYLKMASNTVLVSRNMIDTLAAMGGDRAKMTWSAAGPSQAFFDVKADRASQDFFMLGRLIEKKAPYLSLLAFAQVHEQFPEARLLIGGDGPLEQVCRDITQALGLTQSVVFLGRINQEQQRQHLQHARAFLQHSKVAADGDSEGTPVAILEASAAGVPIISTVHSGIPDTVPHEQTGLLGPEGDVNAMASAMKRLLAEPDLAHRLGEAGKVFVKENFSLQEHIETISSLIDTAISGRSR